MEKRRQKTPTNFIVINVILNALRKVITIDIFYHENITYQLTATMMPSKKPPYVCEICNKEYKDRTGLWRHKKKCSIIQEDLTSKSSNNFHCELCNFVCSRESQYIRHTNTRKHENKFSTTPSNIKQYTCICGKIFKHASSLWNHKQKVNCKELSKTNNIPTTDKEVLIKMLLENQDIMTKLIEVIQEKK